MRYDDYLPRCKTEALAVEFGQELGLLPTSRRCACGGHTVLKQKVNDQNMGFYFRCTTFACRKETSLRKDTFFESSKLPISAILKILYYFIRDNQQQEELRFQLRINSATTIVDWKNFCREVMVEYFIRHPIILGGEGRIVEIDEALLVRRKYNVGRIVRQQWVFGLYDVGSKRGFVCTVENRTRETLYAIISQYILPGSTIISDCWAAYGTLGDGGFNHLTVNHSMNFVDPVTFATTNHVESCWQKIKQKHKARYGTHRTTLVSHLAEYMWRQRFGKSLDDFVEHITELHPFL